MNKAPIVEIFESIQAEGPSLGKPSVFVRFFGCNLRCCYCDTPYAVDKEKDKVKQMTAKEVIKEITKYKSKNIVFTGGEPMLYQNFIKKVLDGISISTPVEIETNGTIPVKDDFFVYVSQFNVSPKLTNSGIKFSQRIKHDALKTFPPNKSIFKFVINTISDVNEVLKLIYVYELKTYLMPEGTDRKTLIKNSKFVVEQCIKNNLNFSPREHIMIWGKKRGI